MHLVQDGDMWTPVVSGDTHGADGNASVGVDVVCMYVVCSGCSM